MAVEEYQRAVLTFWRGRLVGGSAIGPFLAYLEESHDANVWVQIGSTVDTVDASDKITADFSKRWFRVKVVLAEDANGVVALSMWMAGVLERTVR
jgi:hypothetical protein